MLRQLLEHPLVRSSGVYFSANALNSALPFALLPVLTRYLTPEDYGIVSMFSVLVGVAIPVVSLNAQGGVARQFYRRDEIDYPQYVTSAILVAFVGFLVTTGLVLGFADPLAALTEFPSSWMWSVPVFAFAHFFVALRLVTWQLESRPFPFAALQVGLTALELALALTMIVGLEMNWEGRIISRLASATLFAAVGAALLVGGGWTRLSVAKKHVVHALRLGVPLVPHTLGLWVMSLSDRLFITEMVGLDETGIYTVAAQISMVIALASSAFSSAWTPWLFERLKSGTDEAWRRAMRATWAYIAALGALGVAVMLAAPPLLVWVVGPQFAGVATYIPMLVAGMVCLGFYQGFTPFLFYAERTGVLAAITFSAAATNLVLNYVLIDAHGGIGAAEATLVAYALYATATFVAAKIQYRKRSWNPVQRASSAD